MSDLDNSRQVFISYGRDDIGTPFAHELRDRIHNIESHTLSVFLDTSNLDDGEEWHPALKRNIEDSFLVIVLCSEKANQSEYVKFEWIYAMGCKKRIIAIEIQKSAEAPIPAALMEYHSSNMNFTNPSEGDWDALLNTIVSIFEKVFVPSHVERALEFAEHPLKDYREQAIQSLRDNEHLQATEALAFLCENSHIPTTRWLAAVALAKSKKDNRAIPELVKNTEPTGHINLRHNEAIDSISAIGNEEAFSTMVDLYISRDDAGTKSKIIDKFNPPPSDLAISYMRKILMHEEEHPPENKYILLVRLSEMGDIQILGELEAFILDKNNKIPIPNYGNILPSLVELMKNYDIANVLHIYLSLVERGIDNSSNDILAGKALDILSKKGNKSVGEKLFNLVANKRRSRFVLNVQAVAQSLVAVDN